MTLILGMSKPEGIYLGVDYRVTRGGRLVDDVATKHLSVQYPPLEGGPQAVLAFTGVAIVREGTSQATPTGVWLRETLRGESESFDQSMAHLRERLDRDVGGRAQLIVTVVVVQGEKRFFGGLTNTRRDSQFSPFRVHDTFNYVLHELTEPTAFANGSGARHVVSAGHLETMQTQLGVVPRRAQDHMNLLATINRRVAVVDGLVSPYCHVTFVGTTERYGSESRVFAEHGEAVPFEMPFVIVGVDITDFTRDFAARTEEHFKTGAPLGDTDPDVMAASTMRRS